MSRRTRVSREAVRSGLVAAGAIAVGLWLGISVGLATKPKHKPA